VQNYILNFFYWWYAVKGQDMLLGCARKFAFYLESTNTLPMAKNLTVPLFQDNSGTGKFLAIVIRGIWVWWGGMLSVVMVFPRLLLTGLFFIWPLLVGVLLITNITSIIS
jgi:hypothetical protein